MVASTKTAIAYGSMDSPLGAIWIGVGERGLRHLAIGSDEAGFLELLAREAVPSARDDQRVQAVVRELDEYFEGRRAHFEQPVDLTALTPFQRRVLEALGTVPAGQVTTYGALAAQIGYPRAMRAVGQALGRNPVPIVVPCHRVLGHGGGLGGYSGGLEVKRRLLALEGVGHGTGGAEA